MKCTTFLKLSRRMEKLRTYIKPFEDNFVVTKKYKNVTKLWRKDAENYQFAKRRTLEAFSQTCTRPTRIHQSWTKSVKKKLKTAAGVWNV